MNFHAGDQFTDPNTGEVFHIQEMEETVLHVFKSPSVNIYSYWLTGTLGNEKELDHHELVDLINNDQLIEEL